MDLGHSVSRRGTVGVAAHSILTQHEPRPYLVRVDKTEYGEKRIMGEQPGFTVESVVRTKSYRSPHGGMITHSLAYDGGTPPLVERRSGLQWGAGSLSCCFGLNP